MRYFSFLCFFIYALVSAEIAWSRIHFLEVEGTVNPGSASYILESLTKAEQNQADALVLRLNTPGGLLSSTRTIAQGISESSIPVIVWISPGGASATSAGALVAMAAHVAVMAPGTNIGAAHPVGGSGEDVKGVMGEKVKNDTAAFARAMAALRGRSVENAELIVTKSKSFSGIEAEQVNLIDFVADDLYSLLENTKGLKVQLDRPKREATLNFSKHTPSDIIRVEMNLKQKFLHLIADPNVSAMLLALAGLAMWAEVSSGFSAIAPGLVAVFAFVLGMVSLQTLPVSVGGMILIGLSFVLLVLEVFIVSYGILAISSLVCLFLGGLFLIDPGSGSMQVSTSLLVSLVAGVGSVGVAIFTMLARDKHNAPEEDQVFGAEARITTVEEGALKGTALVNGEIWRFETLEPVTTGDLMRVKKVHGLVAILERINKK
jgi:membrane-bound serine protease (ClpP class)